MSSIGRRYHHRRRSLHLLPHRVVDGIVALMFLVGAVPAIREARKAEEEEELVERAAKSGRRVVTTTFIVIFLAE